MTFEKWFAMMFDGTKAYADPCVIVAARMAWNAGFEAGKEAAAKVADSHADHDHMWIAHAIRSLTAGEGEGT